MENIILSVLFGCREIEGRGISGEKKYLEKGERGREHL